MSDRKVVADFEGEIIISLAAIKESGTYRPDWTAVSRLCQIYEIVVGEKCCMSCGRHLKKVIKYFQRNAKSFT